jgi:hypothetical protein
MFRLRSLALAVAAVAALAGTAYAQSSSELVDIYKRNFARSSLTTKYQMLEDAAKRNDPNLAPLFEYALDFVLANADLLGSDVTLRDIAVLSIQMLAKYGYTQAADKMWRLFEEFEDSTVRIPVLRALGTLAVDDPLIVQRLNAYLAAQLGLYQGGRTPEYAIVDECVATLGRLGDSSSFDVLFSVAVSGMSDKIAARALESMSMIEGDLKTYLIGIIRRGKGGEKSRALDIAMSSKAFSREDKAEIATAALEAALTYSSADTSETKIVRELRFRAVRELTAINWEPASELAIRHYREIYDEYNRGVATKSNLLEAIALLGSVRSVEAGEALTALLHQINNETENGKVYDVQITLAVIVNLGILAPSFAFDALLYVLNLQYPEEVKQAARDALEKIHW